MQLRHSCHKRTDKRTQQIVEMHFRGKKIRIRILHTAKSNGDEEVMLVMMIIVMIIDAGSFCLLRIF